MLPVGVLSSLRGPSIHAPQEPYEAGTNAILILEEGKLRHTADEQVTQGLGVCWPWSQDYISSQLSPEWRS